MDSPQSCGLQDSNILAVRSDKFVVGSEMHCGWGLADGSLRDCRYPNGVVASFHSASIHVWGTLGQTPSSGKSGACGLQWPASCFVFGCAGKLALGK